MEEKFLIEDVSDTAFWVAHYRAVETKKKSPLFQDPFAEILSGEKGRQIATQMPWSQYTDWVVKLRTVIIDSFIQTYHQQAGIDAVLNIGAGLDARPYRMDFASDLCWIEVDYPKVIDYKKSKLSFYSPKMKLEQIGLDVADRQARKQLFEQVSGRFNHVLVLTEGVIPYLTNGQVAELSEDLLDVPHFQYWILEYFTQEAIRRMKQKRLTHLKQAPFQFEPADWHAFFQSLGWKPQELRYFGIESDLLNQKSPLPWIFKLIQRFIPQEKRAVFQKFAGFSLLERC